MQKDGRTWRRYTRLESDIIDEELNKLILAGYQCFETKNEPLIVVDVVNTKQPILDLSGKQYLSQVIDMFSKIRKIKQLMKSLYPSKKVDDFKMFIRTNKNNNYQKGSNLSEQHITHFGVHCLNPAYVFK